MKLSLHKHRNGQICLMRDGVENSQSSMDEIWNQGVHIFLILAKNNNKPTRLAIMYKAPWHETQWDKIVLKYYISNGTNSKLHILYILNEIHVDFKRYDTNLPQPFLVLQNEISI